VSIAETIVRWGDDPVAFVEDVFGPGYEQETGKQFSPDRWHRRALGYLVQHEPHGDCDGSPARTIALRGAKGVAKSTWKAWVIWWFTSVHAYANVAAMSISGDNLRDNLWKELATWYSRAPFLKEGFELTAERITPRGASKDIQDRWFVSARTFPQKPDKQQQTAATAGLHTENVAVFIDEGGDVPPGVLHAAEGIFANPVNALVVIGGNCTSVDGALYDASVRRGHRYHVVRVTGDPRDPEHSERVDLRYNQQLIDDYTYDDPVVMINVRAEFPLTAINKLLSPDEVSIAERRRPDERLMRQEPNIYALDVARQGLDLSVLTRRQGPIAFTPKTWRLDDLMALADAVAFEMNEADPEPDALIVLATGIGWGIYDRLKQLGFGSILIGIDEGKSARDAQSADVRTEMWFHLRDWIRTIGCIPEVPELRADLLAPGRRQRFIRGATREILDPGEFVRQALGRSPDRGTSLAGTFAAPVSPKGLKEAQHRQRATRENWNPYDRLRGGR
jgi:hypothetical protein